MAVHVCDACGYSEEMPWDVIWDLQEMIHGYPGMWEDPLYPCPRCGGPLRYGASGEASAKRGRPQAKPEFEPE